MIKHIIVIAFRNIIRNKLYVGINIIGLISSLASTFIILLFLTTELTYDNFHQHRKDIYRIISKSNSFEVRSSTSPHYLLELTKQITGIESACRFYSLGSFEVQKNDQIFTEGNFICADNSIWDIFSFNIISGHTTLMNEVNTIIISKSKALKYFNSVNIVGKEFRILKDGKDILLSVGGVFEDLPINSSLKVDFISNTILLNNILDIDPKSNNLDWNSSIPNTFVLLKKNVTRTEIENKINASLSKFKDIEFSCQLQPLSDVYLFSSDLVNNYLSSSGDPSQIWIYSIVLFILLAAGSSNYIILSTASLTKLRKEIGIRKVFGTNNYYIMIQLISSSIIEALIAFPFSFVVYLYIAPQCNFIFGKHLLNSLQWQVIIFTLIITLLLGALSGYVMFRKIQKFNTADVFRLIPNLGIQKSKLAKILIAVQLIFFICLMQFSSTIYKQSYFLRNKELGFDKENLLIIKRRDFISGDKFNTIKDELNKCPGVINVSAAANLPPTDNITMQKVKKFDNPEELIDIELLAVEKDFIKTFGIKLIEGNDFAQLISEDARNSLIMTKSSLRKVGILNNSIGNQIDFMGEKYKIIGVVDDIYIHSLHNKANPTALVINNKHLKDIAIRMNQFDIKATHECINKCLLTIQPNDKFSIKYFNNLNLENYESEIKLGNVVLIFTIVSAIISCIGLIGLSVFISKERTKEVGIRKVLGASTLQIAKMFIIEFLIIIFIANLFAIPSSILINKFWLQNFAYKTSIQPVLSLLIGILSCVIVLLCISIQTIKTSQANPVNSLKLE